MEIWDDLDDILECARRDDPDVAMQAVDVYVDVVASQLNYLVHIERIKCVKMLISSKLYCMNARVLRQKLLEELAEDQDRENTWYEFVGEVLKMDTAIAPSLQGEIPRVIEITWRFRFTEPQITQVYLEILFVALLSCQNGTEVAAVAQTVARTVSHDFILFLFRAIRDSSVLQDTALLVLLALNDQYMLAGTAHSGDNEVWTILERNGRDFRSVGNAAIVLLNRTSDPTLLILVCKFMWLLFARPTTADLVYTNDLNVLVEVLVRELDCISEDQLELRQIYLRVLHEVLVNTTLGSTMPQCRSTVVQVLRMILEQDREPETMRLAHRCLDVPWLNWFDSGHNDHVFTTDHTTSDHTTTDHTTDYTSDHTTEYTSDASVSPRSRPSEDFDDSSRDSSLSPTQSPTLVAAVAAGSLPPLEPRSQARSQSQSFLSSNLSLQTQTGTPGGRRAPPPPPPPPPPRTNSSASSVVMGLYRPPPPPPPPPPRPCTPRT